MKPPVRRVGRRLRASRPNHLSLISVDQSRRCRTAGSCAIGFQHCVRNVSSGKTPREARNRGLRVLLRICGLQIPLTAADRLARKRICVCDAAVLSRRNAPALRSRATCGFSTGTKMLQMLRHKVFQIRSIRGQVCDTGPSFFISFTFIVIRRERRK